MEAGASVGRINDRNILEIEVELIISSVDLSDDLFIRDIVFYLDSDDYYPLLHLHPLSYGWRIRSISFRYH